MADGTKIEWTHRPGTSGETWNPIRARNRETGGVGHFCVHTSPGCEFCYAERLQPRFKNPVRYAAQDQAKVDIFLDDKTLTAPLRWKKPRTVFVCSMTDLYGEWVSDEWLDRIKAVQALTPHHTYIELTKRSGRMREYANADDVDDRIDEICHELPGALDETWHYPAAWPIPNIWLGVSVEDQTRADERIPDLLETPAVVRWISAEPLLGSIDLTSIDCGNDILSALPGGGWRHSLDWIVAGGESGPNARPMHPDWARSIRDQCAAAGVAFFHKQNGEFASCSEVEGPGRHYTFPDGATVRRVGKHAAGALLDGKEHRNWPA